jgi:hypothetical protein
MFRKLRTFALIVLAAAPTLAACDFHEGPAERAGEKLDRATDRAANAVDDATSRR